MSKSFEKEFISHCNNQELEVNPNQIAVIKKLEQYINQISNLSSQSYFQNKILKKVFIYLEGWVLEKP